MAALFQHRTRKCSKGLELRVGKRQPVAKCRDDVRRNILPLCPHGMPGHGIVAAIFIACRQHDEFLFDGRKSRPRTEAFEGRVVHFIRQRRLCQNLMHFRKESVRFDRQLDERKRVRWSRLFGMVGEHRACFPVEGQKRLAWQATPVRGCRRGPPRDHAGLLAIIKAPV